MNRKKNNEQIRMKKLKTCPARFLFINSEYRYVVDTLHTCLEPRLRSFLQRQLVIDYLFDICKFRMYCIADIFCQIFTNSKTAKFDQWKGQNKVQLCVSINKPGFSSIMANYFRTTWQPYTQGPCFMLPGKFCVIQI